MHGALYNDVPMLSRPDIVDILIFLMLGQVALQGRGT